MSRLACLLLVALALAASGCVTSRAAGEPGGPALAPPDPPPHTVIPVEIVEETPRPPAAPVPAVKEKEEPQVTRRQGNVGKTDPKPPDTTPVDPALPPAPPLQTPENVTRAANEIDKVIRQAGANLDLVNARTLDDERLLQYKTAQQLLQEAKEALKVKNLVFARELADKAATLAAALAKK